MKNLHLEDRKGWRLPTGAKQRPRIGQHLKISSMTTSSLNQNVRPLPPDAALNDAPVIYLRLFHSWENKKNSEKFRISDIR